MNPDPGNPDGNDTDTTAPTFAGAATAVAGDPTTAPGSITINWKAASDDHSAAEKITYLVYQASAASGESFTSATYTTQAGATSYSVSGLTAATAYFFVVRARDEAGNIDTNHAEVKATTASLLDKQAPTFAGLASATADGASHILLSWNDATDNVTKPAKMVYLIYQSDSTGTEKLTQPATYMTPPGATTYNVGGLKAGTDYYFVVRAEDEAMNVDTNTTEKTAKTGTVSFMKDIQPILMASCGGCHSAARPSESLDLSSAAASYAGLVGMASKECTTDQRVVASNPDKSYLLSKLNGAAPTGGCYQPDQMPKGGKPLPADQIALIRDWITAGALNN